MTEDTRPLLTVFTPTYNRAHTLPRLFESLKRQGGQEFEWLLIDDGSTDGTPDLVETWIADGAPFKLRYHRVPNGGKPRAITLACELAKGEYLLIVDSDDYVTDGGIETVTGWLTECHPDPQCIGVGGVRGWTTGARPAHFALSGESFIPASNLQRRAVGIVGEMNEAYLVDVLKRYPFPVWPGENFVPEQVVFNEMALDGWYLHWYDEVVCLGDYEPDGMTANADRLEAHNPMGYATLANHKLKYATGRSAVRAAVQHIALSLVGGNQQYILKSHRPWLTAATLPVGIAMSFRRRRQFRRRLQAGGNPT